MTAKSGSRKSENFRKSWQFNFPCNLTKKINTHTLCFCPLIRKLKAFEILKWAQGSQWRKQRTSNFTCESFSYKGMGIPRLIQYLARTNVLAQGHIAVTSVRLEPAAPLSPVKHSTTEPLRSLFYMFIKAWTP